MAAAFLATPALVGAEATREPLLPVPPQTPSAYEVHLDARRLEEYDPTAITRIHPARLERLVAEELTGPQGLSARVLSLPRSQPLPTPALSGQRLFVSGGYGSHEFYALDATSLKPTWGVSFQTQGPATALPVGDHLLVASMSGVMALLNQRDGRRVWERAVGELTAFKPAVGQGMVATAYPFGSGHRLAVYRLSDGAPLFERQLDGPPVSGPVIHGDSVLVSTFRGSVHRFLLKGGHRVWSQQAGAVSAPVAQGGRVYVTARTQAGGRVALLAMDWATGGFKALWSAPAGPEVFSSRYQSATAFGGQGLGQDADVGQYPASPVAQLPMASSAAGLTSLMAQWSWQGLTPVLGQGVAWLSFHQSLAAINLATGKELWRYTSTGRAGQGGLLLGQPALGAGVVYVAASNGELAALDAVTGQTRWNWQTGLVLRSSPLVAQGRLYAATETGQMLMLTLSSPQGRTAIIPYGGN